MIDDFIDRKRGRKKIEYELPELEEMLKETLGVIVYQEQVMQIANRLAGYSLGEADLLRRAMGKKNADEMAAQRERFVNGAVERGFPQKKIVKIFDLMEQFAGYGFNKSHSAAYALLAYQTAYLKTHYPVEFMAALLTSVTGNTDDVVKYINECREMGIAVEPPDINVSDANFTPHGERHPLWPGGGQERRPQRHRVRSSRRARSWAAFRLDLRVLREGRSAPAEQARAGVVDQERRHGSLWPARAAHGRAGQSHGTRAEDAARRGDGPAWPLWRVSGRRSSHAHRREACPNVPEWDEHQRLANEKEILGFFITGHPLEKYQDKLQDFSALSVGRNLRHEAGNRQGRRDQRAGMVTNVRVLKSRKGDLYAQAVLEDMTGTVDSWCFPRPTSGLQRNPEAGNSGAGARQRARGRGRKSQDDDQRDHVRWKRRKPKLPRSLRIRVPLETATEATVDALHAICASAKARPRCCSTWSARATSWW